MEKTLPRQHKRSVMEPRFQSCQSGSKPCVISMMQPQTRRLLLGSYCLLFEPVSVSFHAELESHSQVSSVPRTRQQRHSVLCHFAAMMGKPRIANWFPSTVQHGGWVVAMCQRGASWVSGLAAGVSPPCFSTRQGALKGLSTSSPTLPPPFYLFAKSP